MSVKSELLIVRTSIRQRWPSAHAIRKAGVCPRCNCTQQYSFIIPEQAYIEEHFEDCGYWCAFCGWLTVGCRIHISGKEQAYANTLYGAQMCDEITFDDLCAFIGRELREWRLFRGLTQLQLANIANLRDVTVCNLEHGKDMRLSTLWQLAKGLDIHISDLLPISAEAL